MVLLLSLTVTLTYTGSPEPATSHGPHTLLSFTVKARRLIPQVIPAMISLRESFCHWQYNIELT